jgi:peptide/nickel transport system substrate-binding protein
MHRIISQGGVQCEASNSVEVKLLSSQTYAIFRFAVVLALLWTWPAQAEKTLRVAVNALPPFLGHPFASTARPTVFTTGAIYDGLIKFDGDGTLMPWLATEWKNVDERTWRFTLRDNVVFSNGSPLTSDSIVAAVEWLTSDASMRDGVRGEIQFLNSARRIDRLTAEITTTYPVPNMPNYMGSLIMVDAPRFRELGRQGYAEAPVGTGPFKVETWKATSISMTANLTSWHAPKLDRLEIIAVPDISGRAQGLLSGRIDIAVGLGPDERMSVEAGGAVSKAWLDPSVAAISFVTVHGGPLADARVRQALNYAVNKSAIIENLFQGLTTPATQGVSHQAFGFNPNLEPYPYDPEKAKALLKDSGYPDGFSFVFLTQTGLGSGTLVFQQVAADLARVGVTMEVRQLPAAAYLNTILRDPTHGGAGAHSTIWPAWPIFDALRPLLMHSCRRAPAWHCDENIQPKIEEALVEWDPVKGLKARHELMAYTRDTAPAIFLYESPEFSGLSPKVTGYKQMHGYINYHEIDLID